MNLITLRLLLCGPEDIGVVTCELISWITIHTSKQSTDPFAQCSRLPSKNLIVAFAKWARISCRVSCLRIHHSRVVSMFTPHDANRWLHLQDPNHVPIHTSQGEWCRGGSRRELGCGDAVVCVQ